MRLWTAITISLLLGTSPAFAHKLYVEAKPSGDQVRCEVFYEDDTPAQEAKVIVLNGETVVAEGRTDEKGVWTCNLPPGRYQVKAETLGHAADTVLEVPARPTAVSTAPMENERAEKTRTPWRRLILGLGIIAGLSILTFVLRRRSK
jgi:hypothetical protein